MFAEIMTWVNAQDQFLDEAKSEFAGGADGWLVAFARVTECSVVTQEVEAPDARKKIPIPNLCREFNVDFVDTFGMLRALGVRFA